MNIPKLDFEHIINQLIKKNHRWGVGFYDYDDLLMILHEIDPFPITPQRNPVIEVAAILDDLGYSMVTSQKYVAKRY